MYLGDGYVVFFTSALEGSEQLEKLFDGLIKEAAGLALSDLIAGKQSVYIEIATFKAMLCELADAFLAVGHVEYSAGLYSNL